MYSKIYRMLKIIILIHDFSIKVEAFVSTNWRGESFLQFQRDWPIPGRPGRVQSSIIGHQTRVITTLLWVLLMQLATYN